MTDDGRHFPAALVRSDPSRGLALLKMWADTNTPPTPITTPLPALALGDSEALKVGDQIYAIGNAFDDAAGDEKCGVMSGVVSSLSKLDVRVGIEDGPSFGKMIITDAPNNPGTQGGPLVTREGKLVGILGRVLESKSTNTTVNFAVPTATLKPLLEDLLAGKEAPVAPPPGARPAPVETGIRLLDAHLTRSPPAYVERVLPGSAAAKAGVKPDDLIFRFDGAVVRTCRIFEDLLRNRQPGEKVKLLVKRGKEVLELEIELAPRKEG
ncbi:trypsin-like peptidase domain-containing protein [bacterium]|nr:trypsin-like peptidase domain-containing protein [bacterium]